MGIKLNADEVLDIAIKAEQNGAAFYKRAAEFCKDKGETSFLLDLADMEVGHERTFRAMKEDLSKDEATTTVFDPDNEAALYLEAIADTNVAEGSPSAAAALTGEESIARILEIAITLEQKGILYYLGLKDLVPAKLGAEKVDAIIKEEQAHVVQLTKKLKQVS